MFFGFATSTSSTQKIHVKIWDATGPGGSPGMVLGTIDVTHQSIMADILAGNLTTAYFTTPITMPSGGNFYAGFSMDYEINEGGLTYDSSRAVTLTNPDLFSGCRDPADNTAWEQWTSALGLDGAWHDYYSSWGVSASNPVWPIIQTNGCPVSTGLTVKNITPSSVKLKWDSVPGALGYKVRYKVAGTSEWTYVNAMQPSRKLTNLTSNTSYTWGVKTYCSLNPLSTSHWSEKQHFTTGSLRSATADNAIFEVYPNPFNSSSVISFSLADDAQVQIQLTDVTGRKLQTVIDENISAGNHVLTLNRNQLNNGIYFLQLKMNGELLMKTVVIGQ